MSALVRLEHVTKTFVTPSRSVTAVDDVSLDIEQGGILGVIGYSGAGKSTLVRLINALEQPTAGAVTVGGVRLTGLPERALREERRQIGMIFQQFNLFHSRTVAGNVAYPLQVAGVPKGRHDARVAELLDFVGLLDRAHSYPEQLSGGQKQRVGIARALATSPRLLLADEATSALDPDTTAEVLALLDRINRELGVTIVVITHEMEAVRAIAHQVAVMDSGRIVEAGDVYDVFATPASPVTARFVSSVLRDRPSAHTVERLRSSHPGRIVSVRVGEERGFLGMVQGVFAEHGVTPELVYGGISELRDRTIGSLTYELTGAAADVASSVAALRGRGCEVVDEASAGDGGSRRVSAGA
ncbi:MAG TPA: methionine ABC transporter ATP-binding protein [Microbacteriaceae bacterium]|nr:methionine ABC transporter ATP-binding protein [Microbacteriaceae bacterium]